MKYPWARIIAELRTTPNQWRLLPEMVARPVTLVQRVRRRAAHGLRPPDGRLYARRGIHLAHTDERAVTDVWLMFVPYPEENQNG